MQRILVASLLVLTLNGAYAAGSLEVLASEQLDSLDSIERVALGAGAARVEESPISRFSIDRLTLDRGRVVLVFA